MIVVFIPISDSNSIDLILEHDDMVFDPRYWGGLSLSKYRFSVNGRILTITKIDVVGEMEGWLVGFYLRLYMPTEDIPDFMSITMSIITVPRSDDSNSIEVQLPHANMVLDPRIIGYGSSWEGELRFSVNGRTLTITRTAVQGKKKNRRRKGWSSEFFLRAYLPTDHSIPDFTSTVYTYHGLRHERAPPNTTEVNFHPSVTTIQEDAFYRCYYLKRIRIPDTVTHIEWRAFGHCYFLRYIRLSCNLLSIGDYAFCDCESVEAVFLPLTITHVGQEAFSDCTSLTFFYIPEAIDRIGNAVIGGCDRLLTIVKYIKEDEGNDEYYMNTINNDEVNQWLMQRYANLPFHRACSSTSITPQVIVQGIERSTEVDIQQMTALHIICTNPHVTGECIRTYLQLAPEAAEQQDFDGMTPFQRLCRNDITFLEERSFS